MTSSSDQPTPPPRPGPPTPAMVARAARADRPAAPRRAEGPEGTDTGSPAAAEAARLAEAKTFGRVGEDGTVYVRTAEGERAVGQWPDGDPDEALTLFARKFDAIAFELGLLEQRVRSGALSPEDAASALRQMRGTVTEAQVVGDLDGLMARLDASGELVAEQRERRRAERARKLAEAQARKEGIAEEAERLATGSDWRNGADRLRVLLDEWKALPRLDKAADDALWRRFSTARTTYTRRRKAHFAELNERREGARAIKERLVREAEALSSSTDWGATAGAYRDLMRRWKEAGPAAKPADDQLWRRFRAAQDAFFGARDALNAATDAEYAENAAVKERLLVEAEALVPVTDLAAAKTAFRAIAERWDAAGKVPRERIKDLEGRMRRVEQAIRDVEDDAWRRSNPEARARAADTVAQLEASLADLQGKHDKALAAGNEKKAAEHAAAIEARRSWLDQARRALQEFSG